MQAIPQPSRAFAAIFLLVLLVLAAFIRIDGTNIYHESPDELNHIEMAQGRDVSEVLKFSHFETHPPLGNLIRYYWMKLSDATWFQRSLSLLFGLPLVPLYYLIGNRLAGRWAGICTASLTAFSFGCIIQSYVIRNYSIFLFFISACFYAWLRWQEKRGGRWLAAYMAMGCLAALTHFSAILMLFCVAAYQTLQMLFQREKLKAMVPWVLANLALACIAAATFYLWYPLLQSMRMGADVVRDWLYPVFVMNYLFFYHMSVPYVFILFTLFAFGLYAAFLQLPAARPVILLTVLALLVALMLVVTHVYIAGMNRHSLWLFPFVISSAGCALSLLCPLLKRFLPDAGVAALVVGAGMALYSSAQRYHDMQEYLVKEPVWKEYTDYLRQLGGNDLILAITSNDAFLTAYPDTENLYDFYYPPHFQKYNPESAYAGFLLPYHRAQLFFKPYYSAASDRDLIAATGEALAQKQAAGIDTLVFLSSRWSRYASESLFLCPSLEKKILIFPPLPEGAPNDKDALEKADIAIMLVPRQAFVDGLMATDGKARACLSQPPS